MDQNSVIKVFVVKDGAHTYYIQEMPGYWGLGRDYAVMKDRKKLYGGRMRSLDDAKRWLLLQLIRDLEQQKLDL